jgi:hypothetical protein
MGWSLSYQHPKEPALVDAALLAAGKSLHLANAFEAKCTFVLHIARLDAYFQAHQDAPLMDGVDAVAAASRHKMLGQALSELQRLPPDITPEQVAALDNARDGRNYIAHEGAAFGAIWSVDRSSLADHLSRLRKAVGRLADGDNIVSRWIYEIEEKEPASSYFAKSYPALVDRWVFGHLPADVLDAERNTAAPPVKRSRVKREPPMRQ